METLKESFRPRSLRDVVERIVIKQGFLDAAYNPPSFEIPGIFGINYNYDMSDGESITFESLTSDREIQCVDRLFEVVMFTIPKNFVGIRENIFSQYGRFSNLVNLITSFYSDALELPFGYLETYQLLSEWTNYESSMQRLRTNKTYLNVPS